MTGFEFEVTCALRYVTMLYSIVRRFGVSKIFIFNIIYTVFQQEYVDFK